MQIKNFETWRFGRKRVVWLKGSIVSQQDRNFQKTMAYEIKRNVQQSRL